MKIVRIFFIGLLILVLLNFVRFGLVPLLDKAIYSSFNKTEKIETPKNKKDCLRYGGEWRRPGPWPMEVCMLKNKDGGKFCLAGFQCESGSCLHYGGPTKGPIFASGYCPKYKIFFGCLQQVHFGFTERAICLD